MPTMTDAKTDHDLFVTEESLHTLYALAKSRGDDVSRIEKAHEALTGEMASRGLIFEPLSKKKKKSTTEDRSPTEAQEDRSDRPVTDGPYVTKDSGPPPSFTHPADDPTRPKGKTKKGKGGEKNRTQDHTTTSVDGDTDDKNPGDLGYITAVKKGQSTAHTFVPVRNICKNCKQGAEAHGDGLDHEFDPVRNICKVCRGGSDLHKARGMDPILKSIEDVEDDDFMEFFKALPQLSADQRLQMGEQGIALPDGSFPIPDEAHLHAAIRLVGQAQDPQSAMNHIIERAHAMGMQDALPAAWNVSQDPNQAAAVVGEGAHSMPGPGGDQSPAAGNTKPVAPGAGGAGAGAQPQATAGTSGAEGALGGFQTTPSGGAGSQPNAGGSGMDKPTGGTGQPAPSSNPSTDANSAAKPKKKTATPVTPGSGPSTPGLMKRLAAAFTKGSTTDVDPDVELESDVAYAVIKTMASPEEMYTLGPVYMPGQIDAHGEWATAEDLQKATWDFVKSSGDDHSVYLQHSDRPAGEWVEIMAWPHAVTATMTKAVDGVQKAVATEFPAGTVYMGVKWEPWAYEMVKSGKITGFSMGGWAQRVEGLPG